MALGDSLVGTASFGWDAVDAGLRGFVAAFPVLRLAPVVRVTFLRFVLFPLIVAPPGRRAGRRA